MASRLRDGQRPDRQSTAVDRILLLARPEEQRWRCHERRPGNSSVVFPEQARDKGTNVRHLRDHLPDAGFAIRCVSERDRASRQTEYLPKLFAIIAARVAEWQTLQT